MEQTYRQADMIELHDSGYIIMRQGASDVENGWREYQFLGGHSIVIDGEELEQLLKHLDIDYLLTITRKSGDGSIRLSLPESRFTIRQEVTMIGVGKLSDYEYSQVIADLSAFVEGASLLHIKVKFQYDIAGDSPTVEFTEKLITYSGRFTVWWSKEATL